MFKLSRRRDHSVQPLTKETADPNAASAAASAFIRGNPTPSSSLSSAAAAAALRAQPSAPTNVAEISSKRSQRRTSSVSSPAGRDRGKSKQQRSPSVSSMSERTFRRSPSPGRTPLGKQDVPPMPSIPASKAVSIPLQTQNFQTASQKSHGQQQGSWFGAPISQNAYKEKETEALSKLPPDLPESRSGSVSSSINFSYPRARITYDSHMTSEPDLVYDPNSRRMHSARTLFNDDWPILCGWCIFGEESPDDDSSFNIPMPTTATETLSQETELEVEGPRDWQNQNSSPNEASEFVIEPNLTTGLASWDNTKSEVPFSYAGSGSETSVRSAHFASSTDQPVVKHEPPPRSLSPRKSALKSAISSRGNQSSHPNENMEYSITGTSHFNKDDSVASQRKGARVSWNDNSTVVVAEPSKFEEEDFAAVHSLQSRQNTQGTFDSLKASRTSSLQEDELMSPRPALPLFGSVRDKKGKEPEERQLVRPREHSLSPQPLPPSNSQTPSSTAKNEVPSPIESTKSLHFGRGQTPRNVANISRYREPLPAIIASTESLGHVSEDMYSSGDELFEDVSTGTEQSMVQKSSKVVSSDSSPLSDMSPDETSKVNSKAADRSPGNSSSDTDPLLMHRDVLPTTEPNSLPGSFPVDDDVSKPHIDDANESITSVLAQTSRYKTGIQEDEESDKDSIYSDAYEDLSEAGDGGFISLDAALVDSPLLSMGGNESRINASTRGMPLDKTTSAPIQSSDDWEKAKAYWKSLTSEERRQLEIEALREADDEAVRERVPTKRTTTLANVSKNPSNSEQRGQRHQSQQDHLLRTELVSVSPGEARQQSMPFQTPVSGRAGFKPADGSRNSSKKNTTMEMKRGEEPMRHTDFSEASKRTYGTQPDDRAYGKHQVYFTTPRIRFQHHSAAPAAPSRSLAENSRHQPFQRHSVAPHINQSLSRKDEDSTYGDHISDSSDDDMNTTPLTNGSITGDEYEPVHSRLKQSILNMYARNNPPDQNSSASAGFNSSLPKHEGPKLRGDQFHNEENAHIPLDQLSEASPRRPGLISTLRRKSYGNFRDSSNAATLQQNTEAATSTRNSVIPNHAIGWPLQNGKGEANEASMTSPLGDTGRRSAASGSVPKDELTSEPRHQHELQLYEGSSDANHANTLLSQEPKRKKFNSLRKMFKINN
ncbi:hypothetical protein TrVFT333_009966 [Trichoderma virens FT-333]|nr:hypothetical protein TrVFT333_009966 [Trichoderma virens FT-333]